MCIFFRSNSAYAEKMVALKNNDEIIICGKCIMACESVMRGEDEKNDHFDRIPLAVVAQKDGPLLGFISLGWSHGSEGEALITGKTSFWDAYGLQVAYQGDGSITILNGGSLILHSASSIGYLANGNITVSGAGSSLISKGSLTVRVTTSPADGWTGVGSLVINNGASFSTEDYVYIGQNSEGTVTIKGNDSEWSDDGIYIGRNGKASFSLLNSAIATSGYASIAYNDESIANVLIDGTGSSWTTDHLYLGRNGGAGSLYITNGGKLTTSGAQIANNYKSKGSIRIDGKGSSWSNEGTCWLGKNNSFSN